jgi:sugar O-acyltransferase (sialic acid O-acetyltransferase NeuD family)
MDKIVVLGGGGHAKVITSILRKIQAWDIIGYTDAINRGVIVEAVYLGTDESLAELIRQHPECNAAIGMGGIRSTEIRRRLQELVLSLGYSLPCIVSPNGIVNGGVSVGQGTVVFDGSVVNTGTTIGACAIINSNATVEHDCQIGDFVHVAPGATICGGVKVGCNAMIGAGSVILQGLTIAENCIVGAGATVVEDCLVPGTYLGTPARRVG